MVLDNPEAPEMNKDIGWNGNNLTMVRSSYLGLAPWTIYREKVESVFPGEGLWRTA